MFTGSRGVLEALNRSLSIIEFDTSGTILAANENFCRGMGYDLSEIRGRHHSMFVDPDHVNTAEYKAFWAKLGRGEFEAREYRRLGKGGKEIWIQASYNPIKNAKGRVLRVVKVASDVTAEKLRTAEFEGQITAISRVQAVIEFTPAGEVITANENFLNVMGYALDEVIGKHHQLFVDPEYARSPEYRTFWTRLNAGEFIAAEFRRIGKGGKEVWIQASYNAIFDLNHRVMKIVKFATDVTGRVRAVAEVACGLSRLAEKDLRHRIDGPVDPAFEKLRTDFNSAICELQHTVGAVAAVTRGVNGGADAIADATADLSRRTERQAASLEKTASALDEITATIQLSADRARQAKAAVSTTREDAVKSGAVMDEAVSAIAQIKESSDRIGQIIGVIDEIAFQTNLLALNAGVEAARAGDAGRGFAVVAQEVRALAQRSADAAREIKGLIAQSSAEVQRGVRLVGDTGRALAGIVAKVAEIDSLIAEISISGQEQASGLADVNIAVNEMDQVTQQNAAMVEQSNAAAVHLNEEAAELGRLVARFDTGGQAAETVRTQPGARDTRAASRNRAA